MEKDELDKHIQNRHKKIVAAEATLITKQQNEMAALKKKLEAVQVGQYKQREVEHNKLLQRYQNVKKELENQQNLERIKFEKSNGRPGTANRSQYSAFGASPSKKSLQSSRMSNRNNAPASKPSNR